MHLIAANRSDAFARACSWKSGNRISEKDMRQQRALETDGLTFWGELAADDGAQHGAKLGGAFCPECRFELRLRLRSNGRMLRPSVVRSITISSASALMVSGPSRLSFAKIENCVVRRPIGIRNWS
jgi:hypothetical protein